MVPIHALSKIISRSWRGWFVLHASIQHQSKKLATSKVLRSKHMKVFATVITLETVCNV
jgi:hypothetical protein